MACANCDRAIPLLSRCCLRCGAPRSIRGKQKVLALFGLGVVGAVFALCAHVLDGSVADHKHTVPAPDFYEVRPYVVVDVPTAPPPSP